MAKVPERFALRGISERPSGTERGGPKMLGRGARVVAGRWIGVRYRLPGRPRSHCLEMPVAFLAFMASVAGADERFRGAARAAARPVTPPRRAFPSAALPGPPA